MYMPGRFRTASSPSRTWIAEASYDGRAAVSTAVSAAVSAAVAAASSRGVSGELSRWLSPDGLVGTDSWDTNRPCCRDRPRSTAFDTEAGPGVGVAAQRRPFLPRGLTG